MIPVRDYKAFVEFIFKHKNSDPNTLRLKWHNNTSDTGFDVNFAILQIECYRKFGKKIKQTLSNNPSFIFPDKLAGEQCTSDALASWHASIVDADTIVVDLTAGLGIDAIHCALNCKYVIALERDKLRAECLRHNTSHYKNIRVIETDCTDIASWLPALKYIRNEFGNNNKILFFIDPARRSNSGARVYSISECQPDIRPFIDVAKSVSADMFAKLSPMLDITALKSELPSIKCVYAVGTTTECKEISIYVTHEEDNDKECMIDAVTIDGCGCVVSNFNFIKSEESACKTHLWDLKMNPIPGYIHVPYPAVMKAGPMHMICVRYDVEEIHTNTHLFLSDTPTVEFPGESYEIEELIPFESKFIKRLRKKYPEIMVSARNFGMNTDTLVKKLGIRDGGNRRLFAVTASDDTRWMIVTKPV